MPGHKILIMGNHDQEKSIQWWMDVGFDEVYPYPILWDKFFILSHESVYVNHKMPYVNIHGHMHNEISNNPRKVNVSVENTDYAPVLFSRIKEKFYFNGWV